MSEGQPTRQELEKLWKQRWEEAKLKLELASVHVQAIQRRMRAESISSSEHGDAYMQAVRAENAALAEYSRVLRIYTDLVAYGKIPDDTPQ